jgi:uncharacterized protein YlxP (DUF503 family)
MSAVVGILQFTLLIRGARSLKDKRRVVRSLKDRLGHHYNISIAEVDSQEIHNQAVLGIAMMGSDSTYVESGLRKILDILRVHPEAELIDHSLELL